MESSFPQIRPQKQAVISEAPPTLTRCGFVKQNGHPASPQMGNVCFVKTQDIARVPRPPAHTGLRVDCFEPLSHLFTGEGPMEN